MRSLKGHSNEVFSVRYSGTEQFLVSSGADAEILVWSMLTQTLNRRLLGHVDCIYGYGSFSFLCVSLGIFIQFKMISAPANAHFHV